MRKLRDLKNRLKNSHVQMYMFFFSLGQITGNEIDNQ